MDVFQFLLACLFFSGIPASLVAAVFDTPGLKITYNGAINGVVTGCLVFLVVFSVMDGAEGNRYMGQDFTHQNFYLSALVSACAALGAVAGTYIGYQNLSKWRRVTFVGFGSAIVASPILGILLFFPLHPHYG